MSNQSGQLPKSTGMYFGLGFAGEFFMPPGIACAGWFLADVSKQLVSHRPNSDSSHTNESEWF